MNPLTIASAKNVLSDSEAEFQLMLPDGTLVPCPAYKLLYDPFDKQKAPAHEQMGMAQG